VVSTLDSGLVYVEVEFKDRPKDRIGPTSQNFAEAMLRNARKSPTFVTGRMVKASTEAKSKA
jgi:hypothetical protein